MKYYHYSLKDLKIGDVIISHQSKGQTYQLVRSIYSKVAKSLGYDLPEHYGYAYGQLIDSMKRNCYLVESETPVIKGDFNHSLYVSMDRLSEFTPRELPLKERLLAREKRLELEALSYFNPSFNCKSIEYISEKFVVVSKL